ncbi:MAG TPA: glycoside hydrolase family 19 protein [Thauera sp.]|jgi:predicted chitinase|nr:glycoside hydrolase family 19 protein [Thauera sp.]
MLITREVLTRMGATGARADAYVDTLNAAMAMHAIDTTPRIAHFLAQLMHESGCLRLTVENLNYSADGLLKVFPRYFSSRTEAEPYARKPDRIGSRVYGARMGNGPEASGEGYRYRGRGLIQLTGKDNYRAFMRWCGEDVVVDPDRVASDLAVPSAVYFWQRQDLNALADVDDLNTITRRINGGLNGFADRRELLEKARRALRELGLAGTVAPLAAPFAPTHVVVPLQLNLRSAPRVSTASLLASLAQGTKVELRGSASAPGWVQVRVLLNGMPREGVVVEHYLAPLAPRPRSRAAPRAAAGRGTEARLPALPVAHLPFDHDDSSRVHDGARAYPLGEADRPLRQGRRPAALAAALTRIVDYLDVTHAAHLRYAPRGGTSFCNTYAADYAYLAGAYLPRVWWSDNALRRLALGEAVEACFGQSVRELNANDIYDWLDEHGVAFGWVREIDLTLLQTAANAGEVCVIVARHRDLNRSGQISLVVPEQDGTEARRRGDGDVLRPLESRASTRNLARGVSASAWWTASRFQSFALWRHP